MMIPMKVLAVATVPNGERVIFGAVANDGETPGNTANFTVTIVEPEQLGLHHVGDIVNVTVAPL